MPEEAKLQKAESDVLDRRIASALQVDGRAPWTSIAHALGESERTVLRRGNRLLDEQVVVVAARPTGGAATVVGIRCEPGLARTTARALAQRPDAVIVLLVTGDPDCFAVLTNQPGELARLLLDDVPGIRGISRTVSQPVLRQVHSIAEWRSGELTDAEVAALLERRGEPGERSTRAVGRVDRADEQILRALAVDGRTTVEELARLTGLSDTTVRRRVEGLTQVEALTIRAVVDPALFGLAVEAVLRVAVAPGLVDEVADEIARSFHTRYVALTTGAEQVLALVAFPDTEALHEFVTAAPWIDRARHVVTSLVLATMKRGGVAPSQR